MPVVFPRLHVERVVEGLAGGMECGGDGLVDEEAPPVHFRICPAPGAEIGPDGYHEMEVVPVNLVDHPLRVRVPGGIEHRLPHRIPPEPVLNDIVCRDMELAVLSRDPHDFILRAIAVLALPETVRPPSEHRDAARQHAVAGDDGIELRPGDEIVVYDIRDFRTEVQRVEKAVVEPAARRIVPEYPVAVRREEEGDGDVRVVL